MKILLLVPYPLGESPSQRFRFEQYFEVLSAAGHTYVVRSFLSPKGWNIIYSKGNSARKFFTILSGFIRRLWTLPSVTGYDRVFIHREATPVGPPVFEWIIAKVMRKKIIYDFDDAIWSTDNTSEGAFAKMIRWRSKVASICKWSFVVSCGNDYLCDYARRFNDNVVLNPTTIDTSYHKPSSQTSSEIVIGWTGSHSTVKYIDSVVTAIQQLEKKYSKLVFMVIADAPPNINVSSLRFVPWNRQTEIEDLSKIDIGIMPLPDDEWSKGKCGFKALQYMAMEIPAVVSPVGVNTKIVTNGVDGFICNTTEEWITALEKLISDPVLRKQLGVAGRKKIESSYSVTSNTSNFLSLFDRSAIIVNAKR
ncbi:MAG: glycosyltransferase family 4 protein [Bacteroidota bacterium]